MAGVIAADVPKCKCGGPWVTTKMRNYDVPVCSSCGKDPEKYRVRRFLPSIPGEPAKRIDIRFFHDKRLTDVIDAIQCMKQIDHEIMNGTFDPMNYGSKEVVQRLRFSHFCVNDYLPHCQRMLETGDLTPATLKIKRGLINNHLLPYFKDVDIRTIGPGLITRFYQSYTKTLRQRDLATAELKVILGLAVQYEMLTGVPKFPKIRKAKLKNPETFYTPEQQDLVISKIKRDKYRVAIWLLKKYGMRPGEVRALHESDVDLFGGILKILRHFSEGVIIEGRKSNGEAHYLHLDDEAKEMITPFLTGNPNAPLFKGDRNGYIAERLLSKTWAQAVAETNLPYIDMYTGTKSSTLTNMYKDGHQPEAIMELSGHTNIDTVKRYAQKRQMDKLEGQKVLLLKKKEG